MKKIFVFLFIMICKLIAQPVEKDFKSSKDSLNEIHNTIDASDILLQLGAGVGGGLLAAIPGGLLSKGFSKDNISGWLNGFYLGYVLGNSLGIYFVADKDKYSPSLPIMILSSAVAAAAGLLIFKASDQKGLLSGAPLYLPPIVTVISLNIFSRKKIENIELSLNLNLMPSKPTYKYLLSINYQL